MHALELQARSLRRYCSPELFSTILVVDNSARVTPASHRERLLEAYGALAPKVQFVDRSSLGTLRGVDGWWRQQVLKIKVAEIVQTERYIVLDAKNHLVRPLTRECFQTHDGRMKMGVHSYSGHSLRRHLERALDYFGMAKEPSLERFSATTPPFAFDTATVRELIAWVSKREGTPYERVVVARGLTEFFLYGAFVRSQGRFDQLYCEDESASAAIWRGRATAEACAEAIAVSHATQTPWFSIQRDAVPKLGRSARDLVAEFWTDRGLFLNKSASAAFLTLLRRAALFHLVRSLPARAMRRAGLRRV
ncbi:MAG: hypothetical protein JNJ73_21525 [Hyphomonadaceae bacterium]|nr:hypothetical protein [Hyphomonadaceae bacterium]